MRGSCRRPISGIRVASPEGQVPNAGPSTIGPSATLACTPQVTAEDICTQGAGHCAANWCSAWLLNKSRMGGEEGPHSTIQSEGPH